MSNLRRAIDSVLYGSGYESVYAIYDNEEDEPTEDAVKAALTELKEDVERALEMLKKGDI
jgi:predicted Zn-dependent peptidase